MKLELLKGSRSRVLAGCLLAVAALFVVRLFYIQIIQHDYYQQLADSEQIKRLTIPAQRGMIYALNGNQPVPLVMNETVYTLFADPATVKDVQGIINTVESVAGGNARSNLDKLLTTPNSRYQILATKLTTAQAEAIKKKGLAGIGFQQESQRVYPEGSLAAQTLGFVDADGNGEYGIEQGMDSALKGKDGMLQSVTDIASVPLTIGSRNVKKPAQNGENVVLTIDRNIQSYVEDALSRQLQKIGAPDGSVIVMNPQNGQVMAMANYPSYDPSTFNTVTDASLFNNNVISLPYEPGSDIKTFTMATGVDTGVVNAQSTYNNTGVINVDGIDIHNAPGDTQFGNITLQTAMNWSLNTGYVTVAERLGGAGQDINLKARQTMYDYFYNRFRLGQLTGIQLAGELPGIIIPPSDPDGNAVRYSNMAFGQGLDVTMLQVASGFSSLVNGGKYYKPSIVAGSVDDYGNYHAAKPTTPTTYIKSSTADQIREMTHVARSSVFPGIDKSGYYMGGKTGTSQAIVNGKYSDTDTIATYLGYGGSQAETKYVIMVRVSGPKFGGSGAAAAMPVFTDISNWLVRYLNIPPQE